jgi:hypothetical protein
MAALEMRDAPVNTQKLVDGKVEWMTYLSNMNEDSEGKLWNFAWNFTDIDTEEIKEVALGINFTFSDALDCLMDCKCNINGELSVEDKVFTDALRAELETMIKRIDELKFAD